MDTVIVISITLATLSMGALGFTLLGIALGKIKV